MDEKFDEYYWILIVGSLASFLCAAGIGANDSANSWSTSVGSKALTLTQAVILAAVFEFSGSVLMGATVTDTVRKNIADLDTFKDQPGVLMYGMLCVLFSTGSWLFLATKYELPVSTTHSVIGGIIGMSLVYGGTDSIIWYEYDDSKDFLSKFKGVAPIIASWFISPFLSACVSAGLFWFSRKVVLRKENSLQRAYIYFPIIVCLTIVINVYFIIFKGFKKKINGESLDEYLGLGYSSLIAWGLGGLISLIVYFIFVKRLKRKHEAPPEQTPRLSPIPNTSIFIAELPLEHDHIRNCFNFNIKVKNFFGKILKRDLHAVIMEDTNVENVHNTSEKFDKKTESTFRYVQVVTSMFSSLAHGSNDVANAVSPLAAIWSIYQTSSVEPKTDVPIWVLILGGIGIVLGLSTYGYKIIRTIGIKLTKITPSRGYCIELASAIVVILGARYGIPLSTTHVQVGATVGVALVEGKKSVNIPLLLKILFGWFITLIIVGSTSALLFSFGIYSPCV